MFLFSLAKFLFWLSITFQQRRQWNPLQYSCLEKPMDRGAWWAAVHGVAKSWTRLSDFTFTFHFHALEKEMATYSSILVWRILWTEEPGGLLSIGLHSQTWLKWLSMHYLPVGMGSEPQKWEEKWEWGWERSHSLVRDPLLLLDRKLLRQAGVRTHRVFLAVSAREGVWTSS